MKVIWLAWLTACSALSMSPPALWRHAQRRPVALRCSGGDTSGKGFGAPKPKPSKPKAKPKPKAAAAVPAAAASATDADLASAEDRGRRMLEQMRQSSNSGELMPKKRAGAALTPEELEPMDPSDGVMPEAVANRMISRVVPFAAIPVVLGVVILLGFYYANTQLELDIPPQIVAYFTQALLLLSFAGITYGVMSTQLDEEGEQTMMGTENLQRNLDLMRGAEHERIADTKTFEESLDAEQQGIAMTPASAKKRARELEQRRQAGDN